MEKIWNYFIPVYIDYTVLSKLFMLQQAEQLQKI